MADKGKWKGSDGIKGVGFPEMQYLHEFAMKANFYFNDTCYLVGSAIDSKDRRDIDVRMILDDDVVDAMTQDRNGSNNMLTMSKWGVLCQAFSALGKQMTELPIDFQIQTLTKCQEYNDKVRIPLGI